MTDNTKITLAIDCYKDYTKLDETVGTVDDIKNQVENFHNLLIGNNVKDSELLKRKETIKLILHYLCNFYIQEVYPLDIKFEKNTGKCDSCKCDSCKCEISNNNYCYFLGEDKVSCINCVVKYFVGYDNIQRPTAKPLLNIFKYYNCDIINSSNLSTLKCPQCKREFTVSDIYMKCKKKFFSTVPYCLDCFINDKVSMGYKRNTSTRINKNSKKSSKRLTSKRKISKRRTSSKRKTSKRRTSKRKSCKIRSRRKLK